MWKNNNHQILLQEVRNTWLLLWESVVAQLWEKKAGKHLLFKVELRFIKA